MSDLLRKQQGRPDWSEVFANNMATASTDPALVKVAPELFRVAVMLCGPEQLMSAVSAAAHAANTKVRICACLSIGCVLLTLV